MKMQKGLIVSCQAPYESPMRKHQLMSFMAEAAEAAGAVAIRAEGLEDVSKIKATVSIPVIGLVKLKSANTPVIITPLLQNVADLLEAGADVIALDATLRSRADGENSSEFIAKARDLGAVILADIDCVEAAQNAEKAGAHAIATTLSGYTKDSTETVPDLDLVKACASVCSVPVIAEGRYYTPETMNLAFNYGAWAVCVGGAITDPWSTTKRFTESIKK
jgi:N-acylglucosamine-6-phosphate 2-epimerase